LNKYPTKQQYQQQIKYYIGRYAKKTLQYLVADFFLNLLCKNSHTAWVYGTNNSGFVIFFKVLAVTVRRWQTCLPWQAG
jgi:hypothetical protein